MLRLFLSARFLKPTRRAVSLMTLSSVRALNPTMPRRSPLWITAFLLACFTRVPATAQLSLDWQPQPVRTASGDSGVATLDQLQRQHILEVLELTGWRQPRPKQGRMFMWEIVL